MADALSRRPDLNVITVDSDPLVEDYKDWPTLLPNFLHSGSLPENLPKRIENKVRRTKDKFQFNDTEGILYYTDEDLTTAFIPFVKRYDMFVKMHAGLGHFGEKTTFEMMRKRMWWPGMAIRS